MKVSQTIAAVLAENTRFRDKGLPCPKDSELDDIERTLGCELPEAFRQFLSQHGLSDLRFKNQILAPEEVLANLHLVSERSLIPIADNGCGDLFCVHSDWKSRPEVVFWDHETQITEAVAEDFVSALREWRF